MPTNSPAIESPSDPRQPGGWCNLPIAVRWAIPPDATPEAVDAIARGLGWAILPPESRHNGRWAVVKIREDAAE